jgi:hypothetical protein
MLLVVVAPLVSRALAHPGVNAAQAPNAHAARHPALAPRPADAHPMHHDTAHGMDHAMAMAMATPPAHGEAASPAATPAKSPDPHAEHAMGVDCDYCLIAARMISLLVALLLLVALWPAVFRALAGRIVARRSSPPGTLGARGPPPVLAC